MGVRKRALLLSLSFPALLLSGCGSSTSGAAAGTDDGGAGEAGEAGEAREGGAPGIEAGGTLAEGGATPIDAASGDAGTTHAEAGGPDAAASNRQSLIWVWMDYPDSLATLAKNTASFTHVSPNLYDVNYDYASGVAEMQSDDGPDDFDGLSSAQIASKVHAMGMKCIPLIQAGAGNSGTDQGIQNIVGDSPKGTQSAFITAMVQEAVTKGYDGYALDWEVGSGTTYATYGTAMTSFLDAFQSALHQKGMELQLIVGSWFVYQSNCSGDTGFVDLPAAAQNVDQVIMMAYDATLGSPTTQCNASVANPANCGNDFGSDMSLMCAYVPLGKINIGYDSDPTNGNNDIAGACVSATEAAGITAVSIWPESNTAGPNGSYVLCDTTDISPAGATWFQLLAGFLAYP
jgi:hypothetical protein